MKKVKPLLNLCNGCRYFDLYEECQKYPKCKTMLENYKKDSK